VFARVIGGLLLLLVLAVALPFALARNPVPVGAVPQPPNIFYGIVKAGSAAVGSGVRVEARIGNVDYAQSVINTTTGAATRTTTTHAVNDQGFNYGSSANFQVCADDTGTGAIEGGKDGDVVTFYVAGIQATTEPATVLFLRGSSQRVDLSVSSLSAPTAAPATFNAAACTTLQATPTPTRSPTPTPTTVSGVGGFFFPADTPTPTTVPSFFFPTATPTPVTVAALQAASLSQAVQLVQQATAQQAIVLVQGLTTARATEIVEALSVERAREVLEGLTTAKAQEIIAGLSLTRAAAVVEGLSATKAKEIIEGISTAKARDIFEAVSTAKGAAIVEAMDTGKAATILSEVGAFKRSDLLSQVAPVKAGAIMTEMPIAKVTEIVQVMSEDKLIERLPEMSILKLFQIPAQLLFSKLPKVPVESLAFEVAPQIDPSLPLPTAVQVTATLAVYNVPLTGELAWGTLVGTPPPVSKVLAKTTRRLSNVTVSMETLALKPANLPNLTAGLVANSFFRITVGNAQPADVASVHTTFFVEKSWVAANGVHKWSLQLQRFDETVNVWVPFSSKRISEDETRIFYSAVLPGLSVFAITGSKELPEQISQVSGLAISPVILQAGEKITVSAKVVNLSAAQAVYPASLWINDTVEATQLVVVPPGAAGVTFSFNITKPDGVYRVRVERELGLFAVGAVPTPTPTPTLTVPVSPTPTGTPPATPLAPATPIATGTPTEELLTPSPTLTPSVTPGPSGLPAGAVVGIVLVLLAVVGGAVAFLLVRRRRGSPPA